MRRIGCFLEKIRWAYFLIVALGLISLVSCGGDNSTGQLKTYYFDSDGDGYGDVDNTVNDSVQRAGWVLVPGDCNDDDSAINPVAVEVCDDVDNDCDGEIDEGYNESCVKVTFYRDSDGDGFGDTEESVEGYNQPDGYVDNNNDCDDSNVDINPSDLATKKWSQS